MATNDSEVMFSCHDDVLTTGQQEGSSHDRDGNESWMAATEPYRATRLKMPAFDQPVDDELGATMGDMAANAKLSRLALEETVSRLNRDVEELQLENQFLKTPRAARPLPLVRQAALTTTKVPWFDGSTSWEQYFAGF